MIYPDFPWIFAYNHVFQAKKRDILEVDRSALPIINLNKLRISQKIFAKKPFEVILVPSNQR
jgi:hypothetical protein